MNDIFSTRTYRHSPPKTHICCHFAHKHTSTQTQEINAKQRNDKKDISRKDCHLYAHMHTDTHAIINTPEATNTLKGPHRCETKQCRVKKHKQKDKVLAGKGFNGCQVCFRHTLTHKSNTPGNTHTHALTQTE